MERKREATREIESARTLACKRESVCVEGLGGGRGGGGGRACVREHA